MATEEPEGGASGRFERMGRKMDQHLGGGVPHLENEVKRMIRYLDDQVVPILRRNSSVGLRAAAERLRALAERLECAREPDAGEAAGESARRENEPDHAGDEPGSPAGEPRK